MGRSPIPALLCLALAAPARAQMDEDIGVRLYDGVRIDSAAVQLGGPSPLKLRKDSQTYGVKLVPPGDSKATNVLVQLPTGPMAIKRYTPCDRVPLEPIPPGGLCLGNGWCDKAYISVEFHKRHLWSNYHSGPPQYFTPVALRKYFVDDIIEPQAGNLSGPPYTWGADCGDTTTFDRICREWGYGKATDPYNHNTASSWDNCNVRWNGTQWAKKGCSVGCSNKRLKCTNPLPECSNGYDDDGDCTSDKYGARGDPPDPDCYGLDDDDESR